MPENLETIGTINFGCLIEDAGNSTKPSKEDDRVVADKAPNAEKDDNDERKTRAKRPISSTR